MDRKKSINIKCRGSRSLGDSSLISWEFSLYSESLLGRKCFYLKAFVGVECGKLCAASHLRMHCPGVASFLLSTLLA